MRAGFLTLSFMCTAVAYRVWALDNRTGAKASMAKQKKAVYPRKPQHQRQSGRQLTKCSMSKHNRFHTRKNINQGQGVLPNKLRNSAGLVATVVPISVAEMGVPAMART